MLGMPINFWSKCNNRLETNEIQDSQINADNVKKKKKVEIALKKKMVQNMRKNAVENNEIYLQN